MRTLWQRLLATFRAGKLDAELDAEMNAHLKMLEEQHRARGLSPEDARRAAKRDFGGMVQAQELYRERRGLPWLEALWQDLRYATRILSRNPGFATVAALTLALGIGANTTIFCALNALVLRPLPLHEPERLVMIRETQANGAVRDPTMASSTEWREHTRAFETIERGHFGGPPNDTLTGLSRAQKVSSGYCTPGYLAMLGVKPTLGRTFIDDDAQANGGVATVISAELWHRSFAADPEILGKTVSIDGKPETIIGVLPPGFSITPYNIRADLWMPTRRAILPQARWMPVVGRLRRGVTAQQGEAELNGFAQGQPGWDRKWSIKVEPLQNVLVRSTVQYLEPLFGAVALVLLIACANVANLLLARATARRKEIAIRISLGAGRWRLVRQLLAECTMLALAGSALGIGVALLGNRLLFALWPARMLRPAELAIDVRVLGFTLALSLLTGILFGLVPALRASRPDLHGTLKEGGRESSVASSHRTQGFLLVVETALAMVLLVGAGLLIRNFLKVQKVELGFNPRNVLSADVLLAGPKYLMQSGLVNTPTPQGALFFEQAMQKIQRIPGVVAVGISHHAPPGYVMPRTFRVVGRPAGDASDENFALLNEVGGAFFRSLEIPLLRGRYVNDDDRETSPWVVNIDQELARRYFSNEDPIGKMVHLRILGGATNVNPLEDRPREIVGVVGDVRYSVAMRTPMPVMYTSYRQHPVSYPGGLYTGHLGKSFTVRTSGDPLRIAEPLQKAIAEVDKDQPVFDIQTLDQRLSEALSAPAFSMRLFGIFAAVALSLAAVGIYGVMSYVVARRRHEIGIRVALGANGRDVLRMVLGRGMLITAIGLVVGIGGSVALTKLIGARLFGVQALDIPTYAVVSAVLLAVALAACWLPARRALRVDPVVALRNE